VKSPGADRAIVSAEKVRDFLLSPVNPRARGKSAFFNALGFNISNWETPRWALLDIARSGNANPGQESEFGAKYEVRAIVTGPAGHQGRHQNGLDRGRRRRFHHRPSRLMTIQLHEEVVLACDVPEERLRRGDLGTNTVGVAVGIASGCGFCLRAGMTKKLGNVISPSIGRDGFLGHYGFRARRKHFTACPGSRARWQGLGSTWRHTSRSDLR